MERVQPVANEFIVLQMCDVTTLKEMSYIVGFSKETTKCM